jgi:hypothetical protein
LVAHLSRWMIDGGLAISALTPATVDAYFAERRATGYYNSLTARSLRPLLDYLRELGVVAALGAGACYESTRAAAGPLSRLPLRRAGAGSLDG